MSKTRDTGFLANVIQVHDTGIRIMSGSEMLMAISSSGAVTITGELSGSDAANSLLLDGTGSLAFTTSGSFSTASGSVSSRITQIEQVYATTGSNSFRATQSITGSLTVTGQIIAQTLNVQQVTSSIVYSSGSNVFGCDINSRQTFTGSFYQTGSVACFSNCLIVEGALSGRSATFSGNVQVGSTSTSTGGLVVRGGSSIGTASAASGQILVGQTSTYRLSLAYDDNTGYAYIDNLYDNANSNIYFRVRTNGTPINALTLLGTGAATFSSNVPQLLTIASTAALGSYIAFTNSGTLNGAIGNGANIIACLSNCDLGLWTTGVMAFQTNGLERMRITSGGNVGIGTSSPNYTAANRTVLDINGTNESLLAFSNGGTARGYIYNTSDTQIYWTEGSRSMQFGIAAGSGFMGFGTNNTERMRITSTGIACFSCQICTPILIATETRLGNSYTCTFPVACVGGQYATVVPPGTLATTEVYLAHIYYDNGSAPPYTANTAFIFKTALVNGGGVDNAVFPATTTHQGGTGCWSFRSVASSPHQSSGLQVQAHSFANNISTATIYLVRLT